MGSGRGEGSGGTQADKVTRDFSVNLLFNMDACGRSLVDRTRADDEVGLDQ